MLLYPPAHLTAPSSLASGGPQLCPVCVRADRRPEQLRVIGDLGKGLNCGDARHLPCDLSHAERVDGA